VKAVPPEEATFATGARRAVPLAVAVAGFGLSFGILSGAAGMPPLAAIVMSLTTFAGSAQFAAVSVLASHGPVVSAVVAAVLLNIRYVPIGTSVAPSMTGGWLRRLLEGQLVVDESWAIGSLGGGRYSRELTIGAGLVLFVAWNVATALGALGGGWLGDPETLGLDAAFPALFLALLAGQVRSTGGPLRQALLAAALGGGIALVLIPFTPPGVPVVAAAVGCLIGWKRAPAAEEAS
jgi:predicted branched-subunit amino acid permease